MTSPAARLPSDQAIRDRAMHDLETSVFLQAGAGTGKTSVLVGRVVHAVRTGRAELREIIAITFTEKAAGELRDRVRRSLYESITGADEDEAARFRAALHQVDSAHIETIHAFASSLLRERPLEAGLDPNFRVLDAVSEQLQFEEAWQNWLWLEEESTARPRIERCLRLGLSLDHLRNLTHSITDFRELDARRDAPPVPLAQDVWQQELAGAHQLAIQAVGISDAVERDVEGLVDALELLRPLPDDALEAALASLRIPSIRAGRNPGEARIRCAESLQQFSETHDEYVDSVRVHALAAFIHVATEFVRGAANDRRRQGTLTFQDLLIEARELLQAEVGVRRYFRERYTFLLIDEFQDTDPLQAEIVMMLAASNDAPSWQEVELEPGRLFIVGDPKQSIYRFRRADIDMYADVLAFFQSQQDQDGGAEVAFLDVNFRSRPGLVDWHNHLFSALIQQNPDFPNAQPNYHRLQPFRQDDGPAVLALQPNTGVSWRRIDEARADEAKAVTRFIQTIVETDDLPVEVQDGQQVDSARPARYRDICILVRNRTKLDLYTNELSAAGIPFHLDSGRGFFLQQEIRDAGVILRALDDPSDEVAVVAALKSAPFSASDLELFEYVKEDGKFQLRASAIPADYDGALREPLEQLRALSDQKALISLPAFVDHVLRATHLTELQLGRTDGVQRAANLQIIVQRAADFANNDVDSLRPFVRWLSQQTRSDLAEAESPVTEIEEDVVRILTIHQAKGLEFPIVIMAKMASADAPDRSIAVVDREANHIDFQIGVRERRFQTPGYAAALQRQNVYEESEERRLFYVAATRARDWLVLPIFHTDRAIGYHRLLEEALPGWRDLPDEPIAPGSMHLRAEHLAHLPPRKRKGDRPDVASLVKRWQETHDASIEAGRSTVTVVAPSSLGHDEPKLPRETEPPDRSTDDVDRSASADDGAPLGSVDPADSLLPLIRFSPDGAAARDRGTAVHDALFLADFHDWPRTEQRARTVFAEKGMTDEADALLQDVRRAFDSALMDRVRAATQVERELPLVSVAPDRIMEGYVDLAFRPATIGPEQGGPEQGGWVLVDYKTDRQPSAETLQGYEEQVRAYVQMFRQTQEPVSEAFLLLTHSGEAYSVPLT
jgi:ATP-dependent helicase/nuclease subunit A